MFGVPRHVVAGAARDALTRFDDQLRLGARRCVQRVNYVNVDAETTAAFVRAFSSGASTPRDGSRVPAATTTTTAAGGGGAATRAARRSRSSERPLAKHAYLQADGRPRRHPAAAVEPVRDVAPSQSHAGQVARRTRREAASARCVLTAQRTLT